MVKKMLTELGRWIDEHSKNFYRDRKYKKYTKRKLYNWTENKLEGFNSALDETEERTSEFEYRAVELTQTEQQKEKRL